MTGFFDALRLLIAVIKLLRNQFFVSGNNQKKNYFYDGNPINKSVKTRV